MPPRKMDPRERVAAWRRALGMSSRGLAKQAGLRIAGLWLIERQRQQINTDQLGAVVKALGLTMSQFFDDAELRRAERAAKRAAA